jgi:hypothetical protein
MTLPTNEPARKQRFAAALALAGLTKKRWRMEHHAVSGTHLDQVLNGDNDQRRGGAVLNASIDALIAQWLPDSPEAQAARAAAEESDEPSEAKIA